MAEVDDVIRRFFVQAVADAIPTELTATPHVGVRGPSRLKIAQAIVPVVEATFQRMLDRIADLERQRDEVLALHRPRVIRGLDGKDIVTEFCAHDDEVMPCPTAAIYGGGQ